MKFNFEKKSLIKQSKNERNAGRKCIDGSKRNESVVFYLTSTEAVKLKSYLHKNKIKGCAFMRSLLFEKGVL